MCCCRESTPCAVSKAKWDTKEDTGKSMRHALYVLWYAKRHLLAEATLNSEKIKPVVLAAIKLRFSERVSQSFSQSFSQSGSHSVRQ